MTSDDLPAPPLVALAAWLIPGSGYWLIGQRTRAVTIGMTIILLFGLGVLIAGIRCVQAPNMAAQGSILSRVLDKPWFLGQVLTGPIGLGSAWASDAAAHSTAYGKIESKSRIMEIGTLYTAVAGMLNLLAIIDSAHRAGNHGNR